MCDKLKHNAVMIQLPIGLENEFMGVVDLIAMPPLEPSVAVWGPNSSLSTAEVRWSPCRKP